MSLHRLLLGVTAATLSLAATAQTTLTTDTQVTHGLNATRLNRNISRFDQLSMSDRQIAEVGQKVSANGLPSKARAQQMLRKGMAKSSAISKLKSRAAGQVPNKAKYQPSDTLFWDSFEGWDGQTIPWLPTVNKWATKSNIEDLTPYVTDGLCPTWFVLQGDGYNIPYAQDGMQFLGCTFGADVYDKDGKLIAPAPEQDEWLVSPTINAIGGTNYLSFDINYAPWDTHFFVEGGDSIFDLDRIAYDVEVLVTTSTRTASFDPAVYTSVYKVSTEVDKEIANTDMDDPIAVASLLFMSWHHVQIPLADFDSKNIRVAFRYTGKKGGLVLIDAVRVSDLLPVALFDRPEGSFFLGFSNSAALLNAKFALMPAYRESVWRNYSNNDVKTHEWRYKVNGESGTSKEYDLTLPASNPTSFVDWPTLQVNAGLRSDQYKGGEISGIKAGGDAALYLDESIGVVNFGLGNYDPTKLNWYAGLGITGQEGGGSAFGTGGDSYWGPATDYEYNKVNGIANVFETPTSPYVFNQVSQAFDNFFNLGQGNLACTVYRATDLGGGALRIEDEVIAQTTECDDQTVGGGHMLVFNFAQPIVVDSPIAISIEGFDDDMIITSLPLAQAYNHDSENGYSFVILRTKRGGVAWVEIAGALASLNTPGNMKASFCMAMNARFPYIGSNDGDIFAAPDNGGEKSFDLNTYWNPNGGGEGAVNPEWKVTCSDSWFKAQTIVDEKEQTVNIRVTADALPTGTEGRYGTVKVTALGCEYTFTVLQGSEVTGIEGITSDKAFNNLDGVYTLSGQRINAADATKGIFLVKKDGKFVKILK